MTFSSPALFRAALNASMPFCSALYGVARSTLDADMVADIHLSQVGPLVKTLGNDFYAHEEMIRDAIRQHGSFNLIHLTTMFNMPISPK
jgi:hypothetical protein